MIYDYEILRQAIADWGFPDYRFEQIIQSVFKQRIGDFECMSILPQSLRHSLTDRFGTSFCSVQPVVEKASQQVKKVLLALPDNNQIEAVALRYKKGWESFCISSQCGCGFGCAFCATGTIGFKCNLTAKEITDQLLYFYLAGHELDSVSFMGMGEPLSNPNVFDALKLLTDSAYFGMSQRKITVSTVGILPGIRQMTKEFPQVNLAFSLHSPFEKQRSELMPVNRKYPLHEVMGALGEHINKTKRKVFIAYILIDGVNDTLEHARAVAKLLQSKTAYPYLYHVDLILYNPTDKVKQIFRTPSHQQIKKFGDLLKAEGVSVTIRAQFGSDIDAACGQLYGEK
jgi:23S rRNA (adenine-C8)-methyltransferase